MQFLSGGVVRIGFLALLGLAMGVTAPPARADLSAQWAITGLVFDDGGTGTATISTGFYGFLDSYHSGALTSLGSLLPGYTYDQAAFALVGPSLNGNDTVATFYAGTYQSGLVLTFANALDVGANVDPLVFSGASYEFTNYGSTKRYLTAGIARAPEPATLSVFAVALAGLAGFGARRRGRRFGS